MAIGGRDLPVFGTVEEAMKETGADVSVVFVPPAFAKAAVVEAVDAAIGAGRGDHRGHPGARRGLVLGARRRDREPDPDHRAELPGHHLPGKSNAGIIPADIAGPGRIGLVSKSGTLTYQMMYELREIGFSTAIGIGGDPIIGTTHIDALEAFEADPETAAIVMIGEIGGDAEERAAEFVKATSPSRWWATWPGSPPPRARPWATPGRSCPARPAPRRPRRRRSRPPGSGSGRPRARPRR